MFQSTISLLISLAIIAAVIFVVNEFGDVDRPQFSLPTPQTAGAFSEISSLRIPSQSTIGGTKVPWGLHCEEDEVIFFTGIDKIGCVHIDTIH